MSFSTSSAATFSLFILHVFLGIIPLQCSASSDMAFSLELIHRDNPKSPHYDPSSTLFHRVMAAAQRSKLRAQQIATRSSLPRNSSPKSIAPDLNYDVGDFLIRYEIGTPPVEIRSIFDTGSDLTWINCKPCTSCYPQVTPLFDPESSSTYKNISCHAGSCKALNPHKCDDLGVCQFQYDYADGTSLHGELASEKLVLGTSEGGQATFDDFLFGCAFQSTGVGMDNAVGVMGFSPKPLSLVSQLESSVGNKFSHCFPPFDKPEKAAKLNFGDAVVYPANRVITPMVPNDLYYAVNLVEIIVGDKTISVPPIAGEKGNMIVDSGTSITYLVPAVLQQVVDAVVGLVRHPQAANSTYEDFGVCFEDQGLPDGYPGITFKFDAGARVDLPPVNVFVKPNARMVCLAMGSDEAPVFGCMAQQNMLVIYDAGLKKMAFAPTDCSGA